jgi:hypothetical protein
VLELWRKWLKKFLECNKKSKEKKEKEKKS